MVDRVAVLHVALDKNYRPEDVEALTNAILQMRGVLTVGYDDIQESGLWLAEARVRAEMQEKLWDVIYPRREKS